MQRILALLCGAAIAVSAASAAYSSEFPTREIRLIVPYGPGGASDQAARKIAEIVATEQLLDQPVVVTNLPAAGTREGLRAVQSATNGHTFLLHHNAFIPAELLGQLTDDLTWHGGFRAVAGLMDLPMTITVLADSPWSSAQELIDDIAARPGEIRFGFPGINVPSYLGTKGLLANVAAANGQVLEIHEIFFEGGAATKAAHMGGQVDVVPAWTMDAIAEANAGVFRVLAVGADTRLEGLDAPSLAETGLPTPPGNAGLALRVSVWGPKSLPDETVAQMEDVLESVYATEAWKQFVANGAGIAVFRTSAEMEAAFAADGEIMAIAAEGALPQ